MNHPFTWSPTFGIGFELSSGSTERFAPTPALTELISACLNPRDGAAGVMWGCELRCNSVCTVFSSIVFLNRTIKETIHVSEFLKCIKP